MKAELKVSTKDFNGNKAVTLEIITEKGTLYISDIWLKNGANGQWLAMPSRKLKQPKQNPKTGKMEEYKDSVFGHKGVKEWIIGEACGEATNHADIPF